MKKKWLALSLTLALSSTSSLLYADTDADIDAQMTNICRCGTHSRIRKAIHLAVKKGVKK